jgi:hypothetical protein
MGVYTMDKQLTEKIKNELVKCGFPLEIYCRKELLKSGFALGSGQYYFNDENKLREIDGEADIQEEIKYKGDKITLFSIIFIECKKSDKKQWVFFHDKAWLSDLNFNTNIKGLEEKINLKLANEYKNIHYYNFKNVAQNYVIPFCNPNSNESRQIYDSLLGLINYAEQHLKEKIHYKGSSPYFELNVLCVIYDGVIIMAEPTENTFKLKEAKHVIVNFNQRKEFKSYNYSIDIVQRSYFKKYLEIIKQDNNTIKEYIQKSLQQITPGDGLQPPLSSSVIPDFNGKSSDQ